MIFGSLLLILVAIVLAVFGVVQGSDSLLVGSIVASLVTAVFLAVGARQAASVRLATGPGAPVAPPDGDRTTLDERVAGAGGAGISTGTAIARDDATAPDEAIMRDEAAARDGALAEGEPAAATDADMDAAVPGFALADEAEAEEAEEEEDASLDDAAILQEQQPTPTVVSIPSQYTPSGLDDEERLGGVRQAVDRPLPEALTQVELDLHPDTGGVDIPIDGLGLDEEPLDEPPAQLVPIDDAVLVATMDSTVIVVDGRPRYHLGSCPHLVGRESESLPVNEAIGLGFTPCSLCEPDTTLLAQARRG